MNIDTQLLRNPNIQPTAECIADGLGTANKTYVKFAEELKQYGITLMDWRYYNDGKAWLSKGEYKWTTARGANKVKPIFWLSIWDGFFKTTFYIPEKVRSEALNLPLEDDVKNMILNHPALKYRGWNTTESRCSG